MVGDKKEPLFTVKEYLSAYGAPPEHERFLNAFFEMNNWEEVKDEKVQIFLAYRDAQTGEWSQYHKLSDGTANAVFPVVTTDDTSLYVAWTERKGETSLTKLQTAEIGGKFDVGFTPTVADDGSVYR